MTDMLPSMTPSATPRTVFSRTVLFLILLISLLHTLASVYSLYWLFWWYDIVMHFLGGIWLGLTMLWVRYYSGYCGTQKWHPLRALVYVVVGTLVVSALWEVFEAYVGVNDSREGYVFDTMLDFVMATIGALTGFWFFLSRPYAQNINNDVLRQ